MLWCGVLFLYKTIVESVINASGKNTSSAKFAFEATDPNIV